MEKTHNYVRIYQDLKYQIQSGVYRDGDKLPTEAQLQNTYGISRITAKKSSITPIPAINPPLVCSSVASAKR